MNELLPRLLTVREAADQLNISSKTLYDLAARGVVPANCIARIGRGIRFIPAPLAAWILAGGGRTASQDVA